MTFAQYVEQLIVFFAKDLFWFFNPLIFDEYPANGLNYKDFKVKPLAVTYCQELGSTDQVEFYIKEMIDQFINQDEFFIAIFGANCSIEEFVHQVVIHEWRHQLQFVYLRQFGLNHLIPVLMKNYLNVLEKDAYRFQCKRKMWTLEEFKNKVIKATAS